MPLTADDLGKQPSRARISSRTHGIAPDRFLSVSVWVLIALTLALTALIADVLAGYGFSTIDQPPLDWTIAHRAPTLTSIALIVSALGDVAAMMTMAVIGCAVLAWRGHWWPAGLVAIAAGGAAVLSPVTKQLVGRARPPVVDRLVPETNQAFPSGHALGSFVVVGILAVVVLTRLRHPLVRAVTIVGAAMFVVAVGVSRLYLGVHWPTDILGGWLMGALWLGICLLGYRILTDRFLSEATASARYGHGS